MNWKVVLVALTVLVGGGCPGAGPDDPNDPLIRPDVTETFGPDDVPIRDFAAANQQGLITDLVITIVSQEATDKKVRLRDIRGLGFHPQTNAVVDGPQIRMRAANVDNVTDSISSADGISKSSSGNFDTFDFPEDYEWTLPAKGRLRLRFSMDIGSSFGDGSDPDVQDFPSGGRAALSIGEIVVGNFVINDEPIITPSMPVYEIVPSIDMGYRNGDPLCNGNPSSFCLFMQGNLRANSLATVPPTMTIHEITFDFVPEFAQAEPLEITNPFLAHGRFVGGFDFPDVPIDVGQLPPAMASLPDGGVSLTYGFTDFRLGPTQLENQFLEGVQLSGSITRPQNGGSVFVTMTKMFWQDEHQLFDGELTPELLGFGNTSNTVEITFTAQ